MTNISGVSTVGFFKNLFFPLKSRFKKMDSRTQNRIALAVNLAGFAQWASENHLLPKLLPVLGISLTPDLKKKVTAELAIAAIAASSIPSEEALNDVWGLENEFLRQIIVMLIFAENSDSRHVLENAKYSSNPNEARVQVLLSIIRLIDSRDDTLIERLDTAGFGKEWDGFVTEFINGAVTGLMRMQRSAMIDSIARKLEALTPRSNTIVEEFIKRSSGSRRVSR